MKNFRISHLLVIVILALSLCSFAAMANATNVAPKRNVFAEKGFIHILGPNPAIMTGDEKAWDGWNIESSDIIKDKNTYYWYYHGRGIVERDNIQKEYKTGKKEHPSGYRLGIATAPTPLGPWTKYGKNPILDYGPLDTWDGWGNACACILKARKSGDDEEKYYMWYNGWGRTKQGEKTRGIGLATASNPLGPWKRYEGNPIITWPHGWLCSVMEVDSKLHMYHGGDGVPFSLATADKPEGSWEKYEHNPLITRGDWGDWDDGGHSEAKVLYREGVFHFFYGGSPYPPQSFESIGYAYSFDGYNWIEYSGNPVVPRERTPDASAFGEVQALIEPPYVYLYYTLRYISRDFWKAPRGEDLGINVLSIDPRFSLSMPILMMDSLGPKKSNRLAECLPIGLEAASTLAIATECTYDDDAKAGLRLHVRASDDGVHCDTDDLYTFDMPFRAGQTIKKTVVMNAEMKFAKVVVENLDKSEAAKSVKVTATVGN